MICISTRGLAPEVGFAEALLGGLAPDGGLYLPKTWPRLSGEEIALLAGRSYAEVAGDVVGRFADAELTGEVISRLCQEAYAGFDHPAVTPLVQIGAGTFLLELFHGPSLAFKDLAMQILARLHDHLLTARGRRATIVCATSGDTGGAAVEAFRGRRNIRLVVLFPAGRISEVQRRFITTAEDPNIHPVAIDGDFDDCQLILKAMFEDGAFARSVDLAAVNSINLVRIIAQSVYYFAAAAALGAPHRAVAFAVPTGNFGDAYAGYAAARMGLPTARIIAATNANDIVARALSTGRYEKGRALPTQSPAMDIQTASNFERLWFDCADGDAASIRTAFRAFSNSGVDIPPAVQTAMREVFSGVAIGEEATAATIRAVHNETGLFVDPHTAVAIAGARAVETETRSSPMVVLATAHPAKFPEAVRSATGVAPPVPARVSRLKGLTEDFDRLPAQTEAVKSYVRAVAS